MNSNPSTSIIWFIKFNTIHGKWTNIPWIRLFSVEPASKQLGVLKAICFTVMPVARFHILNSQDLNHLSHRMASISLHSLCEPLPRFSHCAASVGKKIYFHGGYISDPGQGSAVDIFDPYFESWEQQPTTGSPPPGLYEGVCTSLVDSLYSFAGFDGKNLYNTLHKLDTATLEWRELQPQNPADGPMVKSGCGMVASDYEHLAMFGGYGIPIGPIQRGAMFTENFHRTAAGKGWSNELHLFNIMEGM